MPTHFQMKKFLKDHGIEEGKSYQFTFQQYRKIVSSAKELDSTFGRILMDCFDPDGVAVTPGYEDSSDQYSFDSSAWYDLFGGDWK